MIYLQMFWVWFATFFGFLFQQPYSKYWDEILNDLMDSNASVMIEDHTVRVGGYTIWTSNRWYSYAYPYRCGKPEVRPSIRTMIRLTKYIEEKAFQDA